MTADDKATGKERGLPLSDRAYFTACAVFFAIVFGVIAFAASYFMTSDWVTLDMQRFYAMAQTIVSGATPYLDVQDPKPPLIYFTLTLPILLGNKVVGGLLLVAACNLVSALVVTAMGWKLYGRFAGFIAGLLFTFNIAWAEGYFVFTEPFAITFVLLATYFAAFSKEKHYLIAGICAGIAIGFKQYAALAVPLLLFLQWRSSDLKKATALIAGVCVPLLIIFGFIFVYYGVTAGMASLYWSFGVTGTYLSQANMGDVTSYRTDNPVMLAANIAMATAMFTSFIIIALAGVFKDRKLSPIEQYILLSAVGFSLTILVRQYLHYWVLAVPFYALLCARLFKQDR